MTATEELQNVDVLRRKKFTRDEIYQMLDSGIFAGQRFELIEGDIIDKIGQNPPHVFALRAIEKMLIAIAGFDRVRSQLPFEADGADQEFSEPEPDVAVVINQDLESFVKRHPRGSELSLAVEVADTSLRADLKLKRDLYSRSGVPEYWVLDLNGHQLVVHRKPVDGQYREIVILSSDRSVDFEGMQLAVASMLPPA